MAEITVTCAELTAKAALLERLNDRLNRKIEVLQAKEASLKRMWEGDAKETFSTRFNADKVKMMLFHAEIRKYVNTLRVIAARYETAERKNAATASSR